MDNIDIARMQRVEHSTKRPGHTSLVMSLTCPVGLVSHIGVVLPVCELKHLESDAAQPLHSDCARLRVEKAVKGWGKVSWEKVESRKPAGMPLFRCRIGLVAEPNTRADP